MQAPDHPRTQSDLFGEAPPSGPKPDTVRRRLAELLSAARGAERMPWDEQRATVCAHLFHNMANWLPAPERDTLRAAFAAELARLRRPEGLSAPRREIAPASG